MPDAAKKERSAQKKRADQMRQTQTNHTQACPEILYEDNHLLVAVKLPGVLSQADGSQAPDMLTLLKHYLKVKYQKPGQVFLGLVHRLDRPVGGVMVFARTSKAAARLSEQIRRHELEKIYLAVVDGCPEPSQGQWQDYLEKDHRLNKVTRSDAVKGKAAWLFYKTLQTDPATGMSLIAVKLGTGRGHQIRVQLALHGCPIAGDRKYHPAYQVQHQLKNTSLKEDVRQTQDSGKFEVNAVPDETNQQNQPRLYSETKNQTKNGSDVQLKADSDQIKTAALWAGNLGFRHPVTREWLRFTAPVPAEAPWPLFMPVSEDLLHDWPP